MAPNKTTVCRRAENVVRLIQVDQTFFCYNIRSRATVIMFPRILLLALAGIAAAMERANYVMGNRSQEISSEWGRSLQLFERQTCGSGYGRCTLSRLQMSLERIVS